MSLAGDPAGDPVAGDPVPGDPAGDPLAGDPLAGDPLAGDPLAGDPLAGDPLAGDPLAGDPLAGDPLAGDPVEGDAGGDPFAGHSPGWPLECDEPSDCDGLVDHDCVGGGCVPLIDPVDYVDAASQREASYWWTLQWPSMFDPPERCCFDYTGDGRPDDTLGTMIGLMGSIPGGSTVDYQATIDSAIDGGELVRIIDWRGLPADLSDRDAWLSVLHGLLNGDGAGGAVDLAGRKTGLSHVLVDLIGLGSHGSLWQLNDGAIASAVVSARGGPLMLPFEFMWVPMNLELIDVRMQAPLRLDSGGCQGICSVDETRSDHDPALVAGVQFGGVVEMSQFLDQLDAALRSCSACDTGIESESSVIWYEENETRGTLDIGCCDLAHVGTAQCTIENAPAASNSCGADDPTVCGYSGTMCSVLGIFGGVLDVDIDGDDINDSMSVGFRVGLAGTTIDGLAGQSCDATTCDGAELCNIDTCECGGNAACNDADSYCFDSGAGTSCHCLEGTAGDAFCGGAPYFCADGECINTNEDERYCGSGRVACDVGAVCVAGVCTCGADPDDGTGGAACDPTDTCIELPDGSYRCECAGVLDGEGCAGGLCCGGACIGSLQDESNCNLCGNECSTSQACFDACECDNGAQCADVRGVDVDCCGNACVDMDRSIVYCGGTNCGSSINCDETTPEDMRAVACDNGSCVFRCHPGRFDCDGVPGCEIDLSMADSGSCRSCTGSHCIQRVAEGESIQDAINVAPGGLVIVEDGDFAEHLVITNGTAVVNVYRYVSVALEGVVATPDTSYPLIDANIEIGTGGELHNFTIRGPDVACNEYASMILVTGPDVVIAGNLFEVPTGAISQAIQTDPSAADVTGLEIRDNWFTHLSPLPDNGPCDPDAPNLYDAILIHDQSNAAGTVTIERNRIEGWLFRGIWSERPELVVRDNIVTTLAADPFVAQGNEGMYPVGVHVFATGTMLENNALRRLTRGVAVEVDLTANDDVVITNNCIAFNGVGAGYTGTAGGFTVDATGNYWGSPAAAACPSANCVEIPNDASAALDSCPARVEEDLMFLPWWW